MKTLIAVVAATVAAVTALAETNRTATENWTRNRISEATNETLRLANAYTDAHGGGSSMDTNEVERIANEAVRTNEVTLALVTATNDLTEAVRRLTPPSRDELEAALGWRVVAMADGPAVQFADGPAPSERDRYEAILGYRLRRREDGTPTIEFDL